MAKYTMIVTEEDERYANKEKGLSFFAENPWEGCLNSIVYGDTADELITEAAKTEGLFYQLYESKTGKLVGRGVVSIDALGDDISEYEKSSIIYIGYLDIRYLPHPRQFSLSEPPRGKPLSPGCICS